ncbi:dihydroneopterin aldolase [Niabella drilacis]|uniref:dihydroneopterin aldolase n=1 Tax=Niabella drilacis (strain DSM 25811 / CCM 8410 / CCUG 62505 / LMG 26954 / E90) TaxID=1285928 RepID=A0A1G6YC13_NIADE|nr:dihydroneopterin aldolase [Niabella drilacis]SDD87146.1 dihydroneopterin aldolase [Niabella drilacis]
MAQVITIHLEQLRFFAFHGLYAEEKTTGNAFEMNLSVSFSRDAVVITRLEDTLNYAEVYGIVKDEMQRPRELLETFLTELAATLKERFPEIILLNMSLYKLTVPIEGFAGKVGVALERRF